ncbi:MAG TPA: hypothetical protein VFT53_02175 [Candidatus Saccharimonadales bacterium]|nr:hypothetical protein [Candidatus Saccharimonadales bacterium]
MSLELHDTSTANGPNMGWSGIGVFKYASMTSVNNYPLAARPNEIEQNSANGRGYWLFTPETPGDLGDLLESLPDESSFTEVGGIAQGLKTSGSVLVEGAPVSGKSHLVRDLQVAAVVHNVPTFALSTHVNAGKRTGVENIREPLVRFMEHAQYAGGVVILDNVDYLGYKGSSGKARSRSAAEEYARTFQPLVEELIGHPRVTVLGTAHDNRWREGKWTWRDQAIDGPATATLEAFSIRTTFEGKMALVGLAHILRERNLRQSEGMPALDLGSAARIIRMLRANDMADFFHANHLNAHLFLEDPEAALREIDSGRGARYGDANKR